MSKGTKNWSKVLLVLCPVIGYFMGAALRALGMDPIAATTFGIVAALTLASQIVLVLVLCSFVEDVMNIVRAEVGKAIRNRR